jgi:hypothetical protein
MKAPDISETPLVRRYGVRGAKVFARLWFPLLYVFLIALATGFFVVGPEFATGSRRIFIGSLAEILIVLAASILTRMRLEFLAGIERLEGRGKAA